MPIEGASDALRAAKEAHAEAWDALRHVRCAQVDEAVFQMPRDELRGPLPRPSAARADVLSLGDHRTPVGLPRRRPAFRAVSEAEEGEQISARALEEHLELYRAETPFARAGRARATRGPWVAVPISIQSVNALDLLGFEPRRERGGSSSSSEDGRQTEWSARSAGT